MKSIFFVVFTLILLFIMGCSTKEYVCLDGGIVKDPSLCPSVSEDKEEELVVQAPVEENVSPQTPLSTSPPAEAELYTISDEDKQVLDEKLKKDPVAMTKTVMKEGVHIGETYVFPFAFKNNKNDKREYQVMYIGLDGKTKSNSNAGNDGTIVSWLSKTPQQEFYTVDKNEHVYIPIVVAAGEVINKEGKQTVPGTYKFMVKVGQRQQGKQLYDELGNIIFYVRVD